MINLKNSENKKIQTNKKQTKRTKEKHKSQR